MRQEREGGVTFSHQLVDRTGGDLLEDTWVTVFGFPPAAASYILTQFTQLGTITEHHNPGSGNWMHLKYMVRPRSFFHFTSLAS